MKKLILAAILATAAMNVSALEERFGTYFRYSGTGTNAGDILVTTSDVSTLDACMVMSSVGAIYVEVTLNGTNWTTAPLSLQDFGATTSDPVVASVAGRMYGFVGKYRNIRIKQSGATAATAAMNCWTRQ